jgi:hypothetical protein
MSKAMCRTQRGCLTERAGSSVQGGQRHSPLPRAVEFWSALPKPVSATATLIILRSGIAPRASRHHRDRRTHGQADRTDRIHSTSAANRAVPTKPPETNKKQMVLFGMHNSTLGTYLAAINRILDSLVNTAYSSKGKMVAQTQQEVGSPNGPNGREK